MSQSMELVGEFPDSLINEFGNVQDVFGGMVNDARHSEFGYTTPPDSADIEIEPGLDDDGKIVFQVNSWLESGSEHTTGKFREHGFSFRLKLGQKNLYAVTDAEMEKSYALTARQASFVADIGEILIDNKKAEERRKKIGDVIGPWPPYLPNPPV